MPKHEMLALSRGGAPMRTGPSDPTTELYHQAFWENDPKAAAKAMLELQKKCFSEAQPTNMPILHMSRDDTDVLIFGDFNLSFAKVAAWVKARCRQFGADRYALTVATYAQPFAVTAGKRDKRVIIAACCEDRSEGFSFAWSEVLGDADKGIVEGFRDFAPLDVKLQQVLLNGMLPLKLPSPTGDPLMTED